VGGRVGEWAGSGRNTKEDFLILNFGGLLTGVAQRYPHREAVICGAERVDFRTLEARANRIANVLIGLGLKPGDRVALHMPNCIAAVAGMAAISKAGGMILPVSTRLAGPEIRYIMEDATPFATLYTPDCRGSIADLAGEAGSLRIVTGTGGGGEYGLDDLMAAASDRPPPPPHFDPDDALLVYTSGTTGRPKGAVATHRNIITGQCWLAALEWRLSADDRTLCATPMAHRTGIARMAGSFATGSTLIVQEKFDPEQSVHLIEAERVTHIGVVPTIARMLLPAIENNPGACETLRCMLATGEAFPVPLKQNLFAALPQLGLFSFYSQTEAGLISCLRPEEQAKRPESVGLPATGVEVRFVDENLKDVPDGEPGEVLVRCGAPGELTVMREYFNRPEDTAAVFVDGWLRTGDMARRDEDGYLYFVDRLKDMIVSGGLNIYSREVEDALESHPAVAEAAVIGVPDPEFGESVMAFITCRKGDAPPSTDVLIDHCRARIASYKKPRFIRIIDSLPRNSTGKLAKAELRALAARKT
jgi:acyl-CoA synthetase (AMP-forming)/AMP-acid ligase II